MRSRTSFTLGHFVMMHIGSCFRDQIRQAWLLAALAIIATSAGTGCRLAADGQNLQGVRLFEQGQYEAALNRFQTAATNNPSNADAYYNMAATYHRLAANQGREQLFGQAEELYNRCLDVDADHIDCYRGLAVLLVETGRQDRAFTLLRNWAVRSPELADARIELARLYQEFGMEGSAKIQLQEALQIDQDNARAWAALANLREADGDYRQALANYQRSFSINSMQPKIAERIGAINRQLSGATDLSVPGNTRTVNTDSQSPRY